jgi:hypothetical protein
MRDHTAPKYIPLRAMALELWNGVDPVDAANEADALVAANEVGRAELKKLKDAQDTSGRVQTICSAALLMTHEDRTEAFADLAHLLQNRYLAMLVEIVRNSRT